GIVDRTLSTIAKATGVKPVGWLGAGLQETWNTLDILADAGCEYVFDWGNDDQPYTIQLDDGRQLTSIPYGDDLNDKPVLERGHHSADEFREMMCRQFDVLYAEGETSGRVMGISLHPYLIGRAHAIGALDAALDYICKHEGVWLATGAEIARHFAGRAL